VRKEIQKIGDEVLEGGSVRLKEILPFLEAEGPDILGGIILQPLAEMQKTI